MKFKYKVHSTALWIFYIAFCAALKAQAGDGNIVFSVEIDKSDYFKSDTIHWTGMIKNTGTAKDTLIITHGALFDWMIIDTAGNFQDGPVYLGIPEDTLLLEPGDSLVREWEHPIYYLLPTGSYYGLARVWRSGNPLPYDTVTINIISPVNIFVYTDNENYLHNDSITIFITAENPGVKPVTLNFPSACQTFYRIDEWYVGSEIFCATVLSGMIIPANDSYTWEWIHDLRTYPFEEGDHFVFGELIYYGWSDSVKITISSLDLSETDLFPSEYTLSQNFPNPFNPVTTIRYELPRFSHVRLSIYDILGREVAVLGVGDQGAGVWEVHWDASNVSSGVYFLQMQAGDFRQVRKVMVLK